MKKSVLFAALAAVAAVASAQEMGRVISSTPVIQQIAVPRQVCSQQPVVTQAPKSGAGAAMGAVAGGVMGNAVGQGQGRAAATALGLIGGAILGDKIEGQGQPQVSQMQQCTTQTIYENRTVSYNVVYEFNGKQYTVNLPNDPGPYIKLQITPQSALPAQSAPMAAAPAYPTQVYSQVEYVQAPVVLPAPVVSYPVYYGNPYYSSPVGISLNLGYGWYGGHGGGGHHWR